MADGFGGFIVSYLDRSVGEPGDFWIRAISTKRFDHFGVNTYERIGHWFNSDTLGPAGWRPDPTLVPDFLGGALLAWMDITETGSDCDVHATGIGFGGEVPARPRLTVLSPDAGAPEEALPVTAFGNYLEPDQLFALVGNGFPAIEIDMQHAVDSGIVEGTVDLSGAEAGPRDLFVESPYGADVLENAFGLGDRIECEDDEIFDSHYATAITGGSRRKAVFDEEGAARMAWIEQSGQRLPSLCLGWGRDERGHGALALELAAAAGPQLRLLATGG